MSAGEVSDIALPELPAAVTLTRCGTGQPAAAHVVELTTKLAKTKMGARWWSGLGVSKSTRGGEGDHHWDWAAEVGKHHNKLYFESVAVQTGDGEVQAAMIYRLDGQSVLAAGAGAVLIHWLATAPRNRGWLVPEPEYRGAGTSLITWAAYHSHHLGFGGRIVLATLPSVRTVNFYESLGFHQTTAEEDDMVVYELQPEQAVVLIGRRNKRA